MENVHSGKSIITEFFTEKGNLDDKRYNLETDTDSENSSIEKIVKIQGARIIDEANVFLHYYDHLLDRKIEVYQSRLIMPDNDLKLSQIFDVIPYGLIKKNRTGIGATTLELNSKRNSIIVVPTQSLAISKVESGKDKKTGKYKYLYVGGRIGNKRFPSIADYAKDEAIKYKKYVVVADSLPKLEIEFGDKVYEDNFFMVDEVDSYQYDSHYRPALEDVIDYYFRFPEKQRCLVSATMGFFSHHEIKKEPIIELDYGSPIKRNIDLIHTNFPVKATVDKINQILKEYPNEKILIAYNSISKGIQRVIGLLSDEVKKKCSILCSVKSNIYVEPYLPKKELKNKLTSQISFMTCTYFVGIDFDERYHLISVSDANVRYTLISENRYIQIRGRCRNKKGILSETIIYSTKEVDKKVGEEWSKEFDLSHVNAEWAKYREVLLHDAEVIVFCQTEFNKITRKYVGLKDDYAFTNKEIIEKATKKEDGRIISIVRENIDGELQPAYFNIDSLVIQFNLSNDLYSHKDNLKKALIKAGNTVVCFEKEYDLYDENVQQINDQIDAQNDAVRELELEQVIETLRLCKPEDRLSELSKMSVKKNTSANIFIERFIELEKYVPFEELVKKLLVKKAKRTYNNFYNSVIIWALQENHALKLKIKEEFQIGERYTNLEIAEKVRKIYNSILGIKDNRQNSCLEKAGSLVKLQRKSERSIISKYRYQVVSYNVNNFQGKPLTVIPDNEFIKKKLNL